ncbi:SAM-dependent methyltransferase [Pseudomonadales bacterium]|nr:SAM-dependent methyltransferase [Pseudomonadales bacterium]
MLNESANDLQPFWRILSDSLGYGSWVRLVLSKQRATEEIVRLTVRMIVIKDQVALSFLYSYQARDITKNFAPPEGLKEIQDMLGETFKSAHLLTATEEVQVNISKKNKVHLSSRKRKLRDDAEPNETMSSHNREKNRFVDINRPFLTALGVTDHNHQLIPAMARKWKQVNKFIELFSQALAQSSVPSGQPVQVVDFGSGKGYLTFAVHDYLRNSSHQHSQVVGVELRSELASLCNRAAADLVDAGLTFVCGDVKTHAPEHTDVMIALHACDTATDYAIHYGIRAKAAVIMCSPCCHKQIRPQMHSPAQLKPMLQYGVHLGQEAEMVTDTLRALLLEAHGYHTKVFEFVSLEHTNKNKMILAIKKSTIGDTDQCFAQIEAIKAFYGIQEHCLESLLRQEA